jgi:5'-AMP-activated protein kinase regulatory gamma subunit
MATALRSLLVNATVNDLVSLRQKSIGTEKLHIITIKDDATVDAALKALGKAKVLSAPMVSSDESPIGFIDVKDILLSFLAFVNPQPNLWSMKMLERMALLEEQGEAFGRTKLSDLPSETMGTDGQFIFHRQARGSLLELVYFGLGLKNADDQGPRNNTLISHRFGFFDAQGQVTNIVSQSDIVAFLASNLSSLGPISSKSIESLQMFHKVECVHPEVSAIEAMKVMKDKGLSSLGVVNHDGKLIGNFSASDFRSLTSEHFGSLALPLAEFLALSHHTEFVWHSEHPANETTDAARKFASDHIRRQHPHMAGEEVGQALVIVPPTETFGDLLVKLASSRIHRVYVCQEERPIGICTLTDVLRRVADSCVAC